MRKHYIDNIRWIAVLMLFPYHTAMVWNNFDESFYIWGGESAILSIFVILLSAVFMPLLFVLAGMSAKYALEKRTAKQFLMERFLRLLVPFVAGILLTVPLQTYFAEKFHNGYTGGYFEQYVLFFTKETDFSGYSGGFTPAHLWFLLYLFVISLLFILATMIIKKLKVNISFKKLPFFVIVLLFILPWLMMPILKIGGKSLGEYFILFMLGYYVLSDETILQKTDKYRYILLSGFIVFDILRLVLPFYSSLLHDCIVNIIGWLGILAIIGIGRHSMDFTNRICVYFTEAAFPIYILHQTVLVTIAYVVLTYFLDMAHFFQVAIVMFGSFICTIIIFEITKRIPITRIILGMKPVAK